MNYSKTQSRLISLIGRNFDKTIALNLLKQLNYKASEYPEMLIRFIASHSDHRMLDVIVQDGFDPDTMFICGEYCNGLLCMSIGFAYEAKFVEHVMDICVKSMNKKFNHMTQG